MHTVLTPEGVVVQPGSGLTSADAGRLRDMVKAFVPLARVTVDLAQARDLQDAALVALAGLLLGLPSVKVEFRGVSLHQARVLRYCLPQAGQA